MDMNGFQPCMACHVATTPGRTDQESHLSTLFFMFFSFDFFFLTNKKAYESK